MPLTQLTLPQVQQIFGRFRYSDAAKPKGLVIIDPAWCAAHLSEVTPPFDLRTPAGARVRTVRCHELVAPRLEASLRELQEQSLTHLLTTWDGCQVPRHMTWDPDRPLSYHTWGLAFDVNARSFPYNSKRRQDSRLIALLERHGFLWGGQWHTPDPMHFEISAEAAQHDYRLAHPTA